MAGLLSIRHRSVSFNWLLSSLRSMIVYHRNGNGWPVLIGPACSWLTNLMLPVWFSFFMLLLLRLAGKVLIEPISIVQVTPQFSGSQV